MTPEREESVATVPDATRPGSGGRRRRGRPDRSRGEGSGDRGSGCSTPCCSEPRCSVPRCSVRFPRAPGPFAVAEGLGRGGIPVARGGDFARLPRPLPGRAPVGGEPPTRLGKQGNGSPAEGRTGRPGRGAAAFPGGADPDRAGLASGPLASARPGRRGWIFPEPARNPGDRRALRRPSRRRPGVEADERGAAWQRCRSDPDPALPSGGAVAGILRLFYDASSESRSVA